MANNLGDVLSFQSGKRITNVAKTSLEQLEKLTNYSLKLEGILKSIGFDQEDKEFRMAEENFKIGRKMILNSLGENKRELEDLIKQFKVEFK